jgi:large subunit ribosomal protein L25
MAEITLPVEAGRPRGTRPARRLRGEGKVPAVVYGRGIEATPVVVEWKALRTALTTEAGLNALIDLQMDGSTQLSIVKELQRDPVHHTVIHVDFLLISREEAIEVDVPIVIEGEAEKVLRADGLVEHVLNALTVLAKPGDIPNELVVDVSELDLGDTIRVGDVALPAGVTASLDADEPVVTTTITSAGLAEEEEEEAEEGEGVEGEAAEGEAEAPAAEGEASEGGDS